MGGGQVRRDVGGEGGRERGMCMGGQARRGVWGEGEGGRAEGECVRVLLLLGCMYVTAAVCRQEDITPVNHAASQLPPLQLPPLLPPMNE